MRDRDRTDKDRVLDARIEHQVEAAFARIEPSAGLRSRVQASIEAQVTAKRRAVRWRLAIPLAAAAVLLLVVGLHLSRIEDEPGTSSPPLTSVLAGELATFVASGRSLDVATADPAQLREWFAARVEFTPPAAHAETGLRLTGGRLCHIGGQRVVAYMYDLDGEVVSLYVLQSSPPAIRGNAVAVSTDATHPGYAHASWLRNGLRYALVARLGKARLAAVAKRLARAI